MKPILILSYVESRLDYQKPLGKFIWKPIQRSDHFGETWNTKYAGKTAGAADKNGYTVISIDGHQHWEHQLVWLMETGEFVKGLDHVNHNPADNRFLNLREATAAENSQHRQKACDNTSGYTGVSRNKRQQKWRADICVRGRHIYLGQFSVLSQAIETRKRAEQRYFGEFAYTNDT